MKNPIFTLTTLAFLGLSTLHAQVKIGDNPSNVEVSAALEIESVEKGFLPSRMTTAQRDAINNPVEGLVIYNSTENQMEFFNGQTWVHAIKGIITSGSCIGEPVSFIFQGLEYRPIESSGKCWLDRNLGAARVALSENDNQSFGDLYQWGRASDGHQIVNRFPDDGKINSSTTTVLSSSDIPGHEDFIIINQSPYDWRSPQNDNLWQGVNGINNPCPFGYRIPSVSEWDTERDSWGSSNQKAMGAIASPLKLSMAGNRSRANGDIQNAGIRGGYWSSTVPSAFPTTTVRLRFDDNSVTFSISNRGIGYSLRCIKD